jgi:hypothetical protein
LVGVGLPNESVERLCGGDGWRILMLIGALPGLLTFFIRIFVPESERWIDERRRGSTSFWGSYDLVAILFGAAIACAVVFVWIGEAGELADRFGATPSVIWIGRFALTVVGVFGAGALMIQPMLGYLARRSSAEALAASTSAFGRLDDRWILRRTVVGVTLSAVALIGTWGSVQFAPTWADRLAEKGSVTGTISAETRVNAKSHTQAASAGGAIIGTVIAAYLGDYLGRKSTYLLLCAASLVVTQCYFRSNDSFDVGFVTWTFFVGMTTASFYGWLPLYLPELFPTAVRATAQGFAYNFGRVLAAVGSLQSGALFAHFGGDYSKALATTSLIYLAGVIVIFAPETRGKLPPD